MGSLNPLPSSKRERNRYLVYKVVSPHPLTAEQMGRAVWKSALSLFGEFGVSQLSLKIIEFNEKEQKGIIKVNHLSVDKARSILSLIKEVDHAPVLIYTIGVSGILKRARKKWM